MTEWEKLLAHAGTAHFRLLFDEQPNSAWSRVIPPLRQPARETFTLSHPDPITHDPQAIEGLRAWAFSILKGR